MVRMLHTLVGGVGLLPTCPLDDVPGFGKGRHGTSGAVQLGAPSDVVEVEVGEEHRVYVARRQPQPL